MVASCQDEPAKFFRWSSVPSASDRSYSDAQHGLKMSDRERSQQQLNCHNADDGILHHSGYLIGGLQSPIFRAVLLCVFALISDPMGIVFF